MVIKNIKYFMVVGNSLLQMILFFSRIQCITHMRNLYQMFVHVLSIVICYFFLLVSLVGYVP